MGSTLCVLYDIRTDAARTIVREEGALALYKGAVPALLLCGQGAVQFAVYEWLKARVPKHSENVRRSLVQYSLSRVCQKRYTVVWLCRC